MTTEPTSDRGVEPQKPDRSSGTVWGAVVLIGLGLILLLQQVGDFSFENWWALFILIPALSAFASAFQIWRRAGRFTFAVWSTFYGGLFPLLVAAMFLFDLGWEDYWPLFVVLGGFGTLLSGLPFERPADERVPRLLLRHRPWLIFVGLSATLLGLSFLALNLNLIESLPFADIKNWWGIFILIAALGGLVTALLLSRHSGPLALINLAAAALVAFVGIVALTNLNWNLISVAAAVLAILVGIGLIFGVGGKKDEDGSAL